MTSPMLPYAIQFHNEGLCCIPVKERDKSPALDEWEEYQKRRSTPDEIQGWWGNGHNYNIGLVHGAVSGNYITLDIDKDAGLVDDMYNDLPELFSGRIEQSGSGEGYHVPLRLKDLPDFGFDQKRTRSRGNKTWKTSKGICNIRSQWCQTVAPPSIHPTGNPYRYLQNGPIAELSNLDNLIGWLNKLAPPPEPKPIHKTETKISDGNDLLSEVKGYWDSVLKVFDHFAMAHEQRKEPNGEIRLLGNGGLLITEDLQQFYHFSDDFGGGIFEAWGFYRYGSAYDKYRHFSAILAEMASAAGIAVEVNKWGWVEYQRLKQQSSDIAPGLDIPNHHTVILVAGSDKANVLIEAGFCAVGMPGEVFKRSWAKLFKPDTTVYIALDPGRESQAQQIAMEIKAQVGAKTVACSFPVRADEMLNKYNGTPGDFIKFLKQGRKV